MERNQTFEELKLPVPWGHIAAKAWGPSAGRRILAVHGISDNAGTFDRLINLLPEGYYIVCIDLPGHGFSSHFSSGVPLNFLSYLLSIHHVLNVLYWDTCIYMGHSFGGHLGTMFSILYPKKIEKLILLDALISSPTFNKDLVLRLKELCDIAIKTSESNIPRFYNKEEVLYALRYKRLSALNSEAAEALFERAVTKVGNLYKYNRDYRLNAFVLPLLNMNQLLMCLEQFSTPCIIIAASCTLQLYMDSNIPYLLQKIQDWSYNATIITVDGNHDVHNNHPENVAPHVSRFLDSDIKCKL